MRLLRDQLVIRPDKEEEEHKSESGLYLPSAAKPSLWAYGEVLLLGEYVQRYSDASIEGWPYAVGDRVQYAKHQGTDFELDGDKTVVLTTAGSVYAVLEPALAVV